MSVFRRSTTLALQTAVWSSSRPWYCTVWLGLGDNSIVPQHPWLGPGGSSRGQDGSTVFRDSWSLWQDPQLLSCCCCGVSLSKSNALFLKLKSYLWQDPKVCDFLLFVVVFPRSRATANSVRWHTSLPLHNDPRVTDYLLEVECFTLYGEKLWCFPEVVLGLSNNPTLSVTAVISLPKILQLVCIQVNHAPKLEIAGEFAPLPNPPVIPSYEAT